MNAATYLDALCLGIEQRLSDGLRIKRHLEPIQLRPDRALPLGLVLNELVTNCIKYAAKDRTDAFIKVQFRADIGRQRRCCGCRTMVLA